MSIGDIIPALGRDPAFFVVFTLVALGAIIGSFLNVVALRFISQEDIVSQPSHCPRCGHRLAWLDLFPLFSYIFLKAHCRHCAEPISPQYPIVELAAAVASLILFWPSNLSYTALQAIIVFTAVAFLLVLCVIDARTFLLPDIFIIGLGVLAVIFFFTRASQSALLSAGIGAAVGVGFLWLIWFVTAGQGLGLGDVKLMVPIGFFLGGPATTACLFIAFLIGGATGSFLLATKQAGLKTAIPFGPFLAGSAMILLLIPGLAPWLLKLLGFPW